MPRKGRKGKEKGKYDTESEKGKSLFEALSLGFLINQT